MTLFLTSSPSGCPFEPGPDIPVLDTRNHFVANLRAVWPDHAVLGLAIAADPHAYAQNDEMCRVFAQSFANAHLPLTALIPCDARNAEEIGSLLSQSGFVMLCGGHVPTQNHFFAQLGLPGLFHNYHGIVLGVSAGSMNAARLVYAAPEEPGEAADPGYCRCDKQTKKEARCGVLLFCLGCSGAHLIPPTGGQRAQWRWRRHGARWNR